MGRRVIFYCCNTVTSKTSGLFIDHIWHLIQHVLNICKWCCGACCFWRRYSHWTFCDNTWTRNQLQYRSAVVWSHRSLWHPQSRSNFAQSRTWPYDDCRWRQSSLLEIICRGISVSPYRKADCWRCITLTQGWKKSWFFKKIENIEKIENIGYFRYISDFFRYLSNTYLNSIIWYLAWL